LSDRIVKLSGPPLSSQNSTKHSGSTPRRNPHCEPQPGKQVETVALGVLARQSRAAHCLHVWVGASSQRYVDFAECAQRQDRPERLRHLRPDGPSAPTTGRSTPWSQSFPRPRPSHIWAGNAPWSALGCAGWRSTAPRHRRKH
jgi:hypothetical protein